MEANTKTGICIHYCRKSDCCLLGYCKGHNLLSDRSCRKNGKIHDVFRERNVTNYEFMKSQWTE